MGFCQSFHLKPLRDLIHDAEEVGDGLGTEHCYTGLLEIADAFEEGGGGEVTADVQDASSLVQALHTL